MEYSIEFTRPAQKEYERLNTSILPSEREAYDRAFEQLRKNPYPNAEVEGRIRKISRIDWRYTVTYRYRLVYEIRKRVVVVKRIGHRKDIYRDF